MASFDATYWQERSAYSKLGSYEAALRGLARSHAGIWRLLKPYLPTPGRHVDAGCGHGYMVFELSARGWDSYGFDTSKWMIEQAGRHSPAQADRFATGVLSRVPFEGQFNLITCFEVLEHVPDPIGDLRALATKLKPGGRLIATTPDRRPLVPWPDAVAADPTHISVHDAG